MLWSNFHTILQLSYQSIPFWMYFIIVWGDMVTFTLYWERTWLRNSCPWTHPHRRPHTFSSWHDNSYHILVLERPSYVLVCKSNAGLHLLKKESSKSKQDTAASSRPFSLGTVYTHVLHISIEIFYIFDIYYFLYLSRTDKYAFGGLLTCLPVFKLPRRLGHASDRIHVDKSTKRYDSSAFEMILCYLIQVRIMYLQTSLRILLNFFPLIFKLAWKLVADERNFVRYQRLHDRGILNKEVELWAKCHIEYCMIDTFSYSMVWLDLQMRIAVKRSS